MRIDELVTLNDVLNSDSYLILLQHLKTRSGDDINVLKIKNKVINSWQKGMKSRKHYEDLLSTIDISLNDLIQK